MVFNGFSNRLTSADKDICISEFGNYAFRAITFLWHGILLVKSVFLHNINLDRFEGGRSGQHCPFGVLHAEGVNTMALGMKIGDKIAQTFSSRELSSDHGKKLTPAVE